MTKAPAVFIFFALCASAAPAGAGQAPPTFTTDIAPIVYSQCADCHRPGGSGSFNLLTYADVKRRARAIVAATQRRYMPPWKPDPGAGDFEGVRRLTDSQISLIQRWVDGGAIEGDPSALPPLPKWSSNWTLGEPDVVMSIDRPYTLRASGEDVYRHFVLPVPLSRTRYVKAWEIRVNNTKVVHHATMEFDRTGVSRLQDLQDPEPGYEGLIAHSITRVDGFFLDWAPGHTPYVAPEGMAFPIEQGSDVVLMLHLRPSGKPEQIQVSVGLYFSDTPPVRVPAMLRLTRQDFVIPAGERQRVVTSSYTLPVDVDVFTVQPHAHYLARSVEATATLPDGTTRTLLSISHWDFNWQDVYRYKSPVPLPAGTTVTMKWVYDNSPDNPVNPTQPPRLVTFGQRTSDEMSELWFQIYPRRGADRDRLVASLTASIQDQNLAGYEAMIAANPGSVSLRNDAAELYGQAGKLDDAARHFAEVVRLQPDSASAAYNLGTVRLRQSNLDEARRWFEKAVMLDGSYGNAYRSLGVIAQQTGRADDAYAYYRKAIALAPHDPMSHHNLGVFLHSTGRLDDAVAQYREAIRLNAAIPDAHYGLALIFRQQGRLGESIAEYREALRLRPGWTAVARELDAALAAAQR